MEALEFLSVAGRLALAKSSGPADYRTSISRAYYGTYHLARQLLHQLGFVCRDDNEHLWVQRHFYNCQMQAAREVGRLLGNLHESRRIADYDLDDDSIQSVAQAKFELERASAVQAALQLCATSENVPILHTEMLTYRSRAGVR